MVAKVNIQTRFSISTRLTALQREFLGELMLKDIRKRTQSGKDKNGNKFATLSKEYRSAKKTD